MHEIIFKIGKTIHGFKNSKNITEIMAKRFEMVEK